ncbi:MAG: response regulator [Bdellovibrionales bacterium]|nr:response regulator [Bdellovibrionales bacterium]
MYRFENPSRHFESDDQQLDTAELFSSVLLIEDDRSHATLIKRALNGVVGAVRHESTGRAGIDALLESFTELVLCDLNLPDMTGIQIIAEVRRLRPHLPIIVLTSSSKLDDAVDAMREGAWDFMLKQLSGDLHGQMELIVRRTAERKLQQLRELEVRAERDAFWAAADTAQDGLAILGDEGGVVFSNTAFHNFYHSLHPSEEVDRLNIVDLLARHNFSVARDLHRELNNRSVDVLWSSELETEVTDRQGASRKQYHELTLSAVGAGGPTQNAFLGGLAPRVRYRVFWLRDITRRKEQERFQRDLLSTTTHDLKGPLNAILTSAELMGEYGGKDPARDSELLTRMSSCARNAINIIDELLSARRIQDGVLVVKPRWYRLDEILEDAVLDYLPMAKSKEIDFSGRPVAPDVYIYADRLALNRVLGNLISNAIKFTQKGGKVEVSAAEVDGAVRIAVRDNGAGIEAAARHKLFERFSRLEKHSEVEGTGLGLFVTKNILEAHNGRVDVKSAVGTGTTFYVTFPNGPTPPQP